MEDFRFSQTTPCTQEEIEMSITTYTTQGARGLVDADGDLDALVTRVQARANTDATTGATAHYVITAWFEGKITTEMHVYAERDGKRHPMMSTPEPGQNLAQVSASAFGTLLYANEYTQGSVEWHAWKLGNTHGLTHEFTEDPLSGEYADGPLTHDVIDAALILAGGTAGQNEDDEADESVLEAWERGAYAAWAMAKES